MTELLASFLLCRDCPYILDEWHSVNLLPTRFAHPQTSVRFTSTQSQTTSMSIVNNSLTILQDQG